MTLLSPLAVLWSSKILQVRVGDWPQQPENEGRPFPTFARLLACRGNPEGESDFSWTVDFAARRARARADMAPHLAEVERLKAQAVVLKEQLADLKKAQAAEKEPAAAREQLQALDKAAWDAQATADAIDAAIFDLKVVNPKAKVERVTRSSVQIIESIADYGQQVDVALARLKQLIRATA